MSEAPSGASLAHGLDGLVVDLSNANWLMNDLYLTQIGKIRC
jgi:hypothetical protein